MTDLSLISTDELVEAIEQRFDAVLIVVEQNGTSKGERTVIYQHGPLSHVIGLAHVALDQLMQDSRDGED